MRLVVPLLAAVSASWLSALTDVPLTYVLLGASAIITEELAPLFGGMAASEGELDATTVVWALTLGGWVATTLLYTLGRWRWDVIRRRFPRVRATATLALRVVRRNPVTASFLVRFAFGLRIVLPLACGGASVPWYVYLPVSFVGSAAWSAAYTAIGYVAGEAAVQLMGRLGRAGEIIGTLLLVALFVAFRRWQRARAERKAARKARVQGAPRRSILTPWQSPRIEE